MPEIYVLRRSVGAWSSGTMIEVLQYGKENSTVKPWCSEETIEVPNDHIVRRRSGRKSTVRSGKQ